MWNKFNLHFRFTWWKVDCECSRYIVTTKRQRRAIAGGNDRVDSGIRGGKWSGDGEDSQQANYLGSICE